ncbi:hypothetical protein T484DRAFT_3632687 [Baffinella frigidus]|nr:hypothetical protein T484DRAFT_3632687 [Cryptophyta sp. CCMP2293]
MEGWGEAVRCGFWAAEGDGEDDGAGEGSGRAMRSGRKRRSGESEREAVVERLKKDYLCRTIVMNRVDVSDGRRKDCEGAICDVLGPDEFEVVFYDGCSVTLSGEELEVVLVPEHDTDDEAAARPLPPLPPDDEDDAYEEPALSEMELRRLANIARNQQILRGLDVEEDLRALAAAAARRPAKKKRRDADFEPDEQEAAAPRSPRANPKRAPPKKPARAAAGGGGKAAELRGGALKNASGGARRWTDPEERTLLAEMAAAGIAVEDGAEVPKWGTFMPFALTIAHRFGEHRGKQSIAKKVRQLLLKGPAANKVHHAAGRSGAAGLLGVSFRKDNQRSRPRSLPHPWEANINVSGKQYKLGTFDTAPEAARARDRASLAALGEPAPGATFAQFFNFPDEAAALVSPHGALHPLPDDAHKSVKKFYAANAKRGVTKLHPKMLELWRLHTRASASGTAETHPAGAAAPPLRATPPATEDWRSMLGLSLPA